MSIDAADLALVERLDVDGLKGFPEAITAVFPRAIVQTCIVHLLRHNLDFVSWKNRKPVAAALKRIYKAINAARPRTKFLIVPACVGYGLS